MQLRQRPIHMRTVVVVVVVVVVAMSMVAFAS